ncbi:MAG: bi-domain-containing oxidoreductase [Planctomycetes bacterium]|nr:bi-domain-containing oxidoreductase [Planctomycetota bacterium]
MKQVLQATKGGRTRVADVPPPGLRPGAVLVRTRWSLISAGTERLVIELAEKSLVGKAMARPDLVKKTIEKVRREGLLATYRTVSGRLSGDVPLGYSAAGDVLAVGEGVTDLKPGDRVACAGAGFANHAEILCVPRNLCARVPDGVDLRHASAATLGAIALHGVRTADMRLGEVAVVVGLGILGQLAVQMLAASGVRVVAVDRDRSRAELAAKLGAEAVASGDDDPGALVRGLTSGHGADVAIVAAASDSSAPLTLGASLCRRRGVVVVLGAFGMELDRRLFYEKELTVRMSTSYGPGRYDPVYEERGVDYPYAYVRWTEGRNLESVLDLIARKRLDIAPLLTHEFPIEKADEAYGLVRGETKDRFLGIVLTYEGTATPDEPKRSVAVARKPRGATVGIGVVGAGQFAVSVLLPALRAAGSMEFAAVATSGGATADAIKRSFGFKQALASGADVIAADDVDAVAILTRHDSHAALVAAALAAGKPCFVEKPLAIRREQLADVVAAMDAKPGLVCVGFNRRFAPSSIALRERLAKRTSPIHARYRVNAGKVPAGHWTLDRDVGGGRIIGEACHFVDLLANIVGARIVRVEAERVGPDGAAALLRFGDGSTAVLEYVTSGDPSLGKEHLEVHWEGESFVLDDFRRLTRHAGGKSADLWSGAQDKGHGAEIAAFVSAVRTGGVSPVPFDEAVDATDATFAILEAIAEGTAVDLGA